MSITFHSVHVDITDFPGLKSDSRGVYFPKDIGKWIQRMKQMLIDYGSLELTISSTDYPGLVALGFSTQSCTSDLLDRLREGKDFGFLIDVATARQLSSLFSTVAIAFEDDENRDQ
jgi:hypothetical protein